MPASDDVRAQLDRIVHSRTFQAAAGLRNLLTFVVEETLAGRSENLKEYILGAMVLARGAAFDPKTDPIVRVQMRRLRQRLQKYYTSEGRRDPLVIGFSAGSYAPVVSDHVGREGDGPSTFGACERYVRARYLLGQRNVNAVREAAALVEGIIRENPSFAAAHVSLAECYRMFAILEMMPPADALPKIRMECQQALRVDANLAEAHAAFAGVLAWEWRFAEAEREYEWAIRCGPRHAFVHQRYAIHLAATGRFAEAIGAADRACEIEPLSAACEHTRGVAHYWAGDVAAALDCARHAVTLAPGFGLGHHLLGFMCLHTGDYRCAIGALAQATTLSGASTFDRGYQAYGFGCAGDEDNARQILAELVAAAQREYVAPLSIAHCHLGLGQFDEALTWIERAYVPGRSQWPYYLAARFYEPLVRRKRFQAVVDRIGLPRPTAAR